MFSEDGRYVVVFNGEIYNVGGGARPTSVNEVLRNVSELTGTQPEPIREPTYESDVRLTEAEISSARELLGYKPKVGMREALERTVMHLRERGFYSRVVARRAWGPAVQP